MDSAGEQVGDGYQAGVSVGVRGWSVAAGGLVAIVVVAVAYRDDVEMAGGLSLWLALASLIAVVDAELHRIPNRLVALLAGATILGLMTGGLSSGSWSPVVDALLAGLAASAVGLVLSLASRGGFGMGDVKLLFPVVSLLAWFGGDALIVAYAVSIVSLALALLGRRLTGGAGGGLPMAPFVVLGVAVALIASA